jgi:hypothetical protein
MQVGRKNIDLTPTRPLLLPGYDRRKYVWKLMYIYMLGYDIEFGHKQAADLIPQAKWVRG